jgi:hypothetical protein
MGGHAIRRNLRSAIRGYIGTTLTPASALGCFVISGSAVEALRQRCPALHIEFGHW